MVKDAATSKSTGAPVFPARKWPVARRVGRAGTWVEAAEKALDVPADALTVRRAAPRTVRPPATQRMQQMSEFKSTRIAPAEGKLAVLLPGMGAVATTFIAGVEAARRGLGRPIGSLTQLAHIRLGKRSEKRWQKIQDFVPLAPLSDLAFGGWDPIPDDAYTAAVKARVLGPELLTPLKEFLSAIKPMA